MFCQWWSCGAEEIRPYNVNVNAMLVIPLMEKEGITKGYFLYHFLWPFFYMQSPSLFLFLSFPSSSRVYSDVLLQLDGTLELLLDWRPREGKPTTRIVCQWAAAVVQQKINSFINSLGQEERSIRRWIALEWNRMEPSKGHLSSLCKAIYAIRSFIQRRLLLFTSSASQQKTNQHCAFVESSSFYRDEICS